MKRTILILLFIFHLSSAAITHAGLFGPSNYEECILENMKGVQSDVAAKMIASICRKKFPDEKDTGTSKDKLSKTPGMFDDITYKKKQIQKRDDQIKLVKLTEREISNIAENSYCDLKIDSQSTTGYNITCELFNNNKNITITRLVINLTPMREILTIQDESKNFSFETLILPGDKKISTVEIEPTKSALNGYATGYKFSIASGMGIR